MKESQRIKTLSSMDHPRSKQLFYEGYHHNHNLNQTSKKKTSHQENLRLKTRQHPQIKKREEKWRTIIRKQRKSPHAPPILSLSLQWPSWTKIYVKKSLEREREKEREIIRERKRKRGKKDVFELQPNPPHTHTHTRTNTNFHIQTN